MYLLLVRNGTEFAHVMAHLAKIGLGIALMFVLLFLVNKLAAHASRSGKSKRRYPGSNKGQQRR